MRCLNDAVTCNEPVWRDEDGILHLSYAPRPQPRPHEWGMIVVMLAALGGAGYLFLGMVPMVCMSCTDAKRALTRVSVSPEGSLAAALKMYRATMGHYPTTAEGLAALVEPPADERLRKRWTQGGGPFIEDMDGIKDSWGNDYIYVCPGTHNRDAFDVSSVGRDGCPDTEDDIVSWKR